MKRTNENEKDVKILRSFIVHQAVGSHLKPSMHCIGRGTPDYDGNDMRGTWAGNNYRWATTDSVLRCRGWRRLAPQPFASGLVPFKNNLNKRMRGQHHPWLYIVDPERGLC